MRTRKLVSLILVLVLLGLPGAPGLAQKGPEPVHLVLSVQSDGAVNLNRIDWDVNALSPVYPGTGIRESDYLDLSGRSTVLILCTDLQLIEQLSSEVPRCSAYPNNPAFFYHDDPTWTADEGPITVAVTDPNAIPDVITKSPDSFNLQVLSAAEIEQINLRASTILNLSVPDEAKAFALSSYYRGQGLLFDAITALTDLPDIGCSARRPSVEAPSGSERPLLQSPVVYLRLGELFQMVGQNDDAQRYYECAQGLAEALGDPANTALAYARLANITDDTAEAIRFYQNAINNYATLGAAENADAILNICGLRNCTMP